MAGRYGMSFAKKHIEDGDYEEAVAAATTEIEQGEQGPEPLFDRATAYELLERYDEAVADLEASIEKNTAEKVLDVFMLDDAYFSALLGAAKTAATRDRAKATQILDRYAVRMPEGGHLAEARDWKKRLTGELPSLLDRTRQLNDV